MWGSTINITATWVPVYLFNVFKDIFNYVQMLSSVNMLSLLWSSAILWHFILIVLWIVKALFVLIFINFFSRVLIHLEMWEVIQAEIVDAQYIISSLAICTSSSNSSYLTHKTFSIWFSANVNFHFFFLHIFIIVIIFFIIITLIFIFFDCLIIIFIVIFFISVFAFSFSSVWIWRLWFIGFYRLLVFLFFHIFIFFI